MSRSAFGSLPLWALAFVSALLLAAPAHAQLEQDPEEDSLPVAREGAEPASDPDPDCDADADLDCADDPDCDDPDGRSEGHCDDDSDADVDPDDGAEPLYEPDQRGYEPDQRGYEPDQRGAEEEADSEESPPAPAPDAGGARVYAMESTSGVAGGDGGRFFGAEFALVLGFGGHAIDAIAHDNLVRLDQRGGVYGALGVRAGVRIGPVAIGVTVDSAMESSLFLTRIGGYVSTPLTFGGDAFVPTLRLGFGYALASSLNAPLDAQNQALVDGLFVDLALGVRWTFSAPFFIGLEAVGGYTHLERGGVECTASCTAEELDVRTPGSADGLSLRINLFGGVRF